MSSLIESQHLMQTSECGIHLKLTLHFRNHFHHCAMTAATSAALECINKALKTTRSFFRKVHRCTWFRPSVCSEEAFCYFRKQHLPYKRSPPILQRRLLFCSEAMLQTHVSILIVLHTVDTMCAKSAESTLCH